jgi:hypothetical protein
VLCTFILRLYQTTRRYSPENSALHIYLAIIPDYTALHSRKQCLAHLSCFSTRLHGVTFQKSVPCKFILRLYQTTRRYSPENSALQIYLAFLPDYTALHSRKQCPAHLSCVSTRLHGDTCFTSEHSCYLRGTDALSLVLKTGERGAPPDT